MIRFVVFCVFFALNQVSAEDQLVALPDSRSVDVVLDAGISVGFWDCGKDVNLRRRDAAKTNATLTNAGTVICTFNRSSDSAITTTTIRVAEYEDLPLHMLATSYIQNLFVLKFQYLTLSYHFLSFKNYLPNIAKFFKNSMDKTSSTLDQVTTYLLAKHVTTAALDGSNPPDYTRALMLDGFSPRLDVELGPIHNLTTAFTKAFDMEVKVVQLLTEIGYLAEDEDAEVEEFVNADLIPPMKVYMKTLMDYRRTVSALTSENPKLGEYIFDKELS